MSSEFAVFALDYYELTSDSEFSKENDVICVVTRYMICQQVHGLYVLWILQVLDVLDGGGVIDVLYTYYIYHFHVVTISPLIF